MPVVSLESVGHPFEWKIHRKGTNRRCGQAVPTTPSFPEFFCAWASWRFKLRPPCLPILKEGTIDMPY